MKLNSIPLHMLKEGLLVKVIGINHIRLATVISTNKPMMRVVDGYCRLRYDDPTFGTTNNYHYTNFGDHLELVNNPNCITRLKCLAIK